MEYEEKIIGLEAEVSKVGFLFIYILFFTPLLLVEHVSITL